MVTRLQSLGNGILDMAETMIQLGLNTGIYCLTMDIIITIQGKCNQSTIIGKWKRGHGGNNYINGFDYWNILTDQGHYNNPPMYEMGEEKQYEGYVTDIITDLSIEWMKNRNENQPFMLMCH